MRLLLSSKGFSYMVKIRLIRTSNRITKMFQLFLSIDAADLEHVSASAVVDPIHSGNFC